MSPIRAKIFYSSFLFFVLAITTPLLNVENLIDFLFYSPFFKLESSVWCLKNSNNTNLCKFKNICYDSSHKSLLFFLTEDSVIKGFKSFTDFQKIQLSSVYDHNLFYANISMIDINTYKIKVPYKIIDKALLFSRLKPDNIMHIIHDDLFPIFLTLEVFCSGDQNCFKSYHLVIHDSFAEGPFFDIYKLFSSGELTSLKRLPSNKVVCFREMLTGLVKDSIVYDYGFKNVHGPVNTTDININDISHFSSFLKTRLNIRKDVDRKVDIVLVSRESSRKILNIKDVVEMVKSTYQQVSLKDKVNLVVLDLHLNKTKIFIEAVSNADVLVGMHGAEMIFGLFMKPYSVVVELFPYAVQPEVVSFIKPISELKGSNLFYFSWKNRFKNLSLSHPDAHPLFGGIHHLDEITQNKIKTVSEVPPVQCCNNPNYLYHMYQDTLVPNEFKHFLNESFTTFFKHKNQFNSNHIAKKWFHPYIVRNVSCEFNRVKKLLKIHWLPPFNVKEKKRLKYNLYVVDQSKDFNEEYVTDGLSVKLHLPKSISSQFFQVWISAQFDKNNSKSSDLYFECF